MNRKRKLRTRIWIRPAADGRSRTNLSRIWEAGSHYGPGGVSGCPPWRCLTPVDPAPRRTANFPIGTKKKWAPNKRFKILYGNFYRTGAVRDRLFQLLFCFRLLFRDCLYVCRGSAPRAAKAITFAERAPEKRSAFGAWLRAVSAERTVTFEPGRAMDTRRDKKFLREAGGAAR